MKTYFFAFFLLVNYALLAQAGIHTQSPKATLHVVGKPGVTTSMDGIIAPKLTGNQLNNKTYTTQQDGAIVYVTSPLTNANKGQCVNVNAIGYYFFNKTKWDKLDTVSKMATLADVDVATKVPKKGDRLVYNGTQWETYHHFYAHVGGNDTRAFGEGFNNYIPPTVISDEFNSYNSTTGTITVPYDGLYVLECAIRPTDATPVGTNFGIGIISSAGENNEYIAWYVMPSSPSPIHRISVSHSRIVKLNAGDQLNLKVYADVDDRPGINLYFSKFLVYRL